MRKIMWVLVMLSIAVFLTSGVVMACQSGNEQDHEHPAGVENCPGHVGGSAPSHSTHPETDETTHLEGSGSAEGQSASLGWVGIIGVGAVAGTGYLVASRKRKK